MRTSPCPAMLLLFPGVHWSSPVLRLTWPEPQTSFQQKASTVVTSAELQLWHLVVQDVLVLMQTCVADTVAVTGCVQRLAVHQPAAKASLVRCEQCSPLHISCI